MVDLGDNYVALIPKSYKPERIENAIKKLHLRLNVLQNYVEWHNSTDNKSIEIKSIQVITTKDYSSENMPNAGRDKFLYRDGKKQMDVLNRNLDECMLDLPKDIFFKINDSHIINKRFINEPKDKEVMVNLTVVEKNKVVVKPVSIKISPLCAEEFKAFYYT